MKQKNIAIAAGITVIAGAVFYYLRDRNSRRAVEGKLQRLPVAGEQKIRHVMHEAKMHD